MAKPSPSSIQLLRKKQILDQTQVQLKTEFIGIDKVIDEVMDAIGPWYMFPELQDRPVVINLWGLTGVGKSSLVNRCAELIGFKEKFYRFDLGAKDEWAIHEKLSDIYEHADGFPIILALDEFQHARTINEVGNELEKFSTRIVWEILDNGKFQVTRYSDYTSGLYDLTYKLRCMLMKGVQVRAGKVISNESFFLKEMGDSKLDDKGSSAEEIQFVPEHFHRRIHDLAREKFRSVSDVGEALSGMSGYGTIDFLEGILEFIKSPKTVDCSKALVFVLGNLDEAYTMSSNYNPDISADEFHEESLRINISHIKRALKLRFRNEQIARLGNIHIIYPAFNRDSFRKIIWLELSKISHGVKQLKKLELGFDESIVDIIYSEGVFPTQGTRPVLTTIHQVISTKLGKVFTEMFLHRMKPDKIFFRTENDSIIIDFLTNKQVIHSFSQKQVMNLEVLRKNRKDDLQAIVAVHEAGHAVIATTLLKTVPDAIFSISAHCENTGLVSTRFKWKYVAKREILYRLAMFLGGFVAEKIVFGDDYVTVGSEGDLIKATAFISDMLKESGMGRVAAAYHVKSNSTRNFLHDEKNEVNDEIEKLLTQAQVLAEKTLREQGLLLLKLSDHLSDHRSMNKEEIKNFLLRYARNFNPGDLIENGDDLYYRKELKRKVLEAETSKEASVETGSFEISLNKFTSYK